MSTTDDVSVIDRIRQMNSSGLELYKKRRVDKGLAIINEALSELEKRQETHKVELAAQYCFLASIHLSGASGKPISEGLTVVVKIDTSRIPKESFTGLVIDKMETEKGLTRDAKGLLEMAVRAWTQLCLCSEAVELYKQAASILQKCREVSRKSLEEILLQLKKLHSSFGLEQEAQSIYRNAALITEEIENKTGNPVIQKSSISVQRQLPVQDAINTFVYTSGEIYAGEMRSGVPEGIGEIWYPDGARYTGEVRNMCLNGIGAHVAPDGRKYIGGFRNDRFHGEGTLTLSDGSCHSGNWREGLLYLNVPDDQEFVHPLTKMRFPALLSGIQRERIINYELTKPGLGVSIGYSTVGILATVYIYTNRRSSIPDGADSGIVKKELERAEKDIIQAKEAGQYDSVVKHKENRTRLDIGDNKIDFIYSEFQVTEKGSESHSFIYLTGFLSHFLKMRFTYGMEIGNAGLRVKEQVMFDLGKIMWLAQRHHQVGQKESDH